MLFFATKGKRVCIASKTCTYGPHNTCPHRIFRVAVLQVLGSYTYKTRGNSALNKSVNFTCLFVMLCSAGPGVPMTAILRSLCCCQCPPRVYSCSIVSLSCINYRRPPRRADSSFPCFTLNFLCMTAKARRTMEFRCEIPGRVRRTLTGVRHFS